jgi:hypothetical protein
MEPRHNSKCARSLQDRIVAQWFFTTLEIFDREDAA